MLSAATLRAWPLPQPEQDGDKEERGRTLIIATTRSAAPFVALAVPEARVIGLPETLEGGLEQEGTSLLEHLKADAVLIGLGMQDEPATVGSCLACYRNCKGYQSF